MKIFEVRSTYPCLVKWHAGEEFLEEGYVLQFDKPEKLFIYPTTGRREDVPFVLDMEAHFYPVKVFDVDDKRIFYLQPNSLGTMAKEKITLNSKTINFKIASTFVEVETDEIIKNCECIKPKTYEIISYEKFAILKIKGENSDQAIVFDSENNSLTSVTASRIDFENGELICEKQGREEKFVFADGNLVKTKSLQTVSRNPKITGMLFLQKLKNGEYREASLLVSDRLGSNEEKLAAYFGEIQDFFALDDNQFLVIKKSGHYVVKLDLNEDKIANIEILD